MKSKEDKLRHDLNQAIFTKAAVAGLELDHYRKTNRRTRRICNGFDLKGCENDSVKTEGTYGFCYECYEKRSK